MDRLERAMESLHQYLSHSIRSHNDQIGQLVEAQQVNTREIAELRQELRDQSARTDRQISELVGQMMIFSEIVRSHKRRLDQIDGKTGEA